MRIGRLHLMRYGALTERELVFRPDAAIHVVYGANEAGKSTALNALSDLLFGFGRSRSHDFLHDAATLRLGATLHARDGDSIAFRRRRGNKNTILSDAEDEEPLREDALLPYLGNVTRPIFERAFGLDSARLRAGSQEMLASGGEMGTMLFAASSGILGLADARRALETDAEKIFTPRRSGQRAFYQILDRHEAARAEERKSELRSTEWKRLNEDIDRLQEEHDAKARDRADLRRRQAEIENLTRLRPILAEMDEEARQLLDYEDIADLPDDMGVHLASALAGSKGADASLRQAEATVDKVRRDADRIDLQPALVSRMSAITDLFEKRGAVRTYVADLPRVTAERDQFNARLDDLARRLGMDRTAFDAQQPSDPEIARVEDCLARLREAGARIEDIDRRIGEDKETLARLMDDRPQAAIVDPKPWRSRVDALKPDIDRLATLQTARAELAGRRRRLAETAARLEPTVGDLDRLACSPLPARSELAAYRDAMNEAEGRAKSFVERLKSAREEIGKLNKAITDDESASLPTRQSIAEARATRDDAIAELAAQGLTALSQANLQSGVGRIRALVQAADVLADAVLREAERLARLSANIDRRDAVAASAARTEEDVAGAEETVAGLSSDYEATFRKAGVEPLNPDRMMDWHVAVEALLRAREEMETEAERTGAIGELEEQVAEPLRTVADGIGVSGQATLSISALMRAVDERLQALQRVWDDSRSNAISRQHCEAHLKRLEGERTEAVAARDLAATELKTQAVPLGLGEEAVSVEIAAAIAAWKQVPGIRAEQDNRHRRIIGMEREVAAFEEKVSALVAELAPDLGSLTPGNAIGVLNETARQAMAAADREREVRAELAEAEELLADAVRLGERAQSDLLAVLADCAKPEDAATLAARLAVRDDLRAKHAACRMRLRQVSPDMNEKEARTALHGFDPVEAGAEVERLAIEEARLDEEVKETYAQLSARRAERTELGHSNGAETAAFERKAAEAEMVGVAREWSVLKLASSLLGAAIERQRQAGTDPALARAGDSFRALTSGGFHRLAKRFNDDDAVELVAVRDSGEEIGLDAMSDGTVDQLHLALRIAYLEDYCTRNEPMPFIADDIFQTFDDGRTRAAIAALGSASAMFQPIIFTHHRSLVAAAQKTHGEKADVIEL